jgi:hypothetical protein
MTNPIKNAISIKGEDWIEVGRTKIPKRYKKPKVKPKRARFLRKKI